MKNRLLFRRFFAMLLLLAVSMLSFAYDFEVNGIYYNKNSDGKSVTVTYKNTDYNSYSGTVVIPSSVEYNEQNYPVTSIGYAAFRDCYGLTSINIPNSVTSIGERAFYGCSGLTRAEFASIESLCNISFGNYFANPLYYAHHLYIGGTEVKDVVIPNSVTSIGGYAFFGCSGLTSITIPNSVTSIGTYAFSGCSGLTSITIPNSVTSIGTYAFSGCSGLTSITIPQSVISIGSSAFYGCSGLTSVSVDENNPVYDSRNHCNAIIETTTNTLLVGCKNTTIPNSVTSIGDYAFSGCSSLTSITIPNSVTSIGEWAFNNCSGLTSITIPNSVTSIGDQAFLNCSGLTSVTIPNSVTSIGWSAFYGCTSLPVIDNIRYADTYLVGAVDKTLSTYSIKAGTRFIGEQAFYNCSGLTSITIPNGVTSIGYSAFQGCSGLTSITIPNSVTSIDGGAFYGCSALTSITIPNSVTYIGGSAFSGCSGLTSVTIPNSVTSIGYEAFSGCPSLTSVTIPNSVTSIGSEAFRNCSGLTSVSIPNSVTSIGDEAFSGCSGLTSVTINSNAILSKNYTHGYGLIGIFGEQVKEYVIGNSVTSIGNYAFESCSGLTSVTIPNGVTSIGDAAFRDCSGLTSVTIGNSVTSIGSAAFYGCSGLTSVIIPNNVTSIGNAAFSDCSGLTSITIPNSVTSIGWYAFYGCTSLPVIDDIRYADTYLVGAVDRTLSTYSIKAGTRFIGEQAFYNCSGLTSITIPNSVTRIYDYAFSGCSGLTSVTIGSGVTSIGDDAFENCTGLTKAEFVSIESLCKISFTFLTGHGSNPLYYAKHLYLNGEEVKDLIIPNSVTSIGNYAFYGCSGLTSVTIPESVTSIGSSAFYGCSGLKKVTCLVKGTDRRTEDLPVVTEEPTKPLPGVEPNLNEAGPTKQPEELQALYLYPFNPAHPDDPTVDNVEETVEVTAHNVYPEAECKAKWLDYYKKLYSARQAMSRANNRLNTLMVNPYIRRSASELVSLYEYEFEWEDYMQQFEYYKEYIEYMKYTTVPVPETARNTFEEVPLSDATLYVYEDVIDAYRVTSPWSEFGQILPIDPLAVEEVKSGETAVPDENAPIYDLMGRRLQQKPTSGYYIQGGKKYFVK